MPRVSASIGPHELFPDFERRRFTLGDVAINAVIGGSGPPLLLLHGHPQTLAIWHRIAPRLAARYTVVATDLRGYGDSAKPRGLADHSNYSKRAMAADQLGVMRALGFERFRVVAHDRGARVAHRLALDHAGAIERLVLLDIAPTLAMYEQTTREFATAYFHWFFLIQPYPYPETLVGADPEFHVKSVMGGRFAGLKPFAPEALAEYLRCARDPATIHGWCEDYRAAASIDLEHDRHDRERGHNVTAPLLVLWGGHGVIQRCFDPLAEWRRVATDVRGRALECGHYIPEEAPEALLAALDEFL
jgi:haloacetate dehalogenase